MNSLATAGDSSVESESYISIAKAKALDLKHAAVDAVQGAKVKAASVISNRNVQVTAASAVGGAVLVGGASGMIGLTLGGASGAFVGMGPALFTFGLSIPVFAAIGGGFGLFAGVPVGGTAGAVGGGTTGYVAYTKRAEIKSFTDKGCAQARGATQTAWASAVSKSEAAVKFAEAKKESAKALALTSAATAQQKLGEGRECASKRLAVAKAKGIELASDRSVQVGAVSAAGGAAACGTAGAVAGLCTGTVVGGAVGLVPAIFTFGLSIPIGAAIGGSCGLVAGATTGGTVGFVGGGAAGYSVHARRDEIGVKVKGTISKVNEGAEYMKGKASTSAAYVRARVVGGTGGTD
jgi:hypothetical protein